MDTSATRTGWFGATAAKAWFGAAVAGDATITPTREKIDFSTITSEQKADIEAKMREEKGDEYVEKLKSWTMYNGACPADPYEALMCEACQ